MLTNKCTKEGCLGYGRFVAKDTSEVLKLAKQKKLRPHCQLCDSWWTLTEEEQLAVEKNLGKS